MKDIVRRVVAIDGVSSVVVMTSDGFFLDGMSRDQPDVAFLAAVGSETARAARKLLPLMPTSNPAGPASAPPWRLTFESGGAQWVLQPIEDVLIAVHLTSSANLGYLKFVLDESHAHP